jgi:poly(A) polymerase
MQERPDARGPESEQPRPTRRRQRRRSEPPDSSDPPTLKMPGRAVPRDGAPASRPAQADSQPSEAPAIYHVEFDEGKVDLDAVKVVRRLVRQGYEGYLVGGCVRDLLVSQRPKDFDVATNARPDDVRRLFRNSRIIGRRFRLVHVLFANQKVIETATFRKSPDGDQPKNGDDLLIRNDNVFGEAPEDAMRRDFTINGLFYDVERKQVIDWVGGMPDIEARTVRTIGNPVVRFLEDPVRILRAIKFSARIDFGIAPEVYDAIVQCRGSLAMAARPRLFEELLRLLRGGASHRSIWLAWETGVLDVLLPELAAFLSDSREDDGLVWRMLTELDRLTRERGAPFDDIVLCTVLLLEPMREACAGEPDRAEAAFEFLEPVIDRLNVPRRIADAVRRIGAMLPRLEAGKSGRFARTPLGLLAHDVLSIRQSALGIAPTGEAPPPSSGPVPAKRRRRRRPRRRGE